MPEWELLTHAPRLRGDIRAYRKVDDLHHVGEGWARDAPSPGISGFLDLTDAELDALAAKSVAVQNLVTAIRDLLDIAEHYQVWTVTQFLDDEPQVEHVRSLLAKFEHV